MEATARVPNAGRDEAGFTLVEALVAMVVLSFGLMAVTNLLVVAASSNSVANQGTAAVTSATHVMDLLKMTPFTGAGGLPLGGPAWGVEPGAPDCAVAVPTDFHCTEAVPGVGSVHTHWWISATADPRLLHIRVRSEGTGALAQARSRAEFTNFRACTAGGAGSGGVCPDPL